MDLVDIKLLDARGVLAGIWSEWRFSYRAFHTVVTILRNLSTSYKRAAATHSSTYQWLTR